MRKRDWMLRAMEWELRYKAQEEIVAFQAQALNDATHRIEALEDRMQSQNLVQFKAARHEGFAMPDLDNDKDELGEGEIWAEDPTGIFRQKLPPLTPAEEADLAARIEAGWVD